MSTPQPQAESSPTGPPSLALPGAREGAGAGMAWVTEGWKLFMRAPLMWVISVIITFVIMLVLSILPLIGPVLFQVFQAVIVGGLMFACRSLETGGEFELEHLFAGFKKRFGPLAILGLLMFVGTMVIVLVFAMFAGVAVLGVFMGGDPEAALATVAASAGSIVLGTLVMTALFVPLLAAYWFAPSLVMLHAMKPLEAMKVSFFACMRNFMPFLVYGIVMFVALLIAMIPFGLGMLVWIPLTVASTYVAYRRILTA